ncbi:MAG: DNA polymerase III subunit epsilon [Robiginitomaculum sp.]|nr:MAG: DNA polymerase III subunit epsilon [Robiginitomaculum sp.]
MTEGLREIAFDTETTGFEAWGDDRLTEIGCVELIDFLPTGNTFHTTVHPEGKEISAKVTEITGHTNESLRDAPKFIDVAQKFRDFVGESQMIAHNANFDMGFINAAMKRYNFETYPTARFIDTLTMAREKFPGASNTLDALCKRFDISLASRTVHGALVDAELLAKVYLELRGGRALTMDFETEEEIVAVVTANTRPRPNPIGLLSTDTERAIHEDFIKSTLGENPIWKRYD